MKKHIIALTVAGLFLSTNANATAQMWCLKDTTECAYGTPSGMTTAQRTALLYKMTIEQFVSSVVSGSFKPVTPTALRNKALAPTPTPTPAPSPTWILCAVEGGVCNFTGTRTVRYGANTSFNQSVHTNTVNCNNSVFGDPLSGVHKSCFVSTAPTPTPTPTPAGTNIIQQGLMPAVDISKNITPSIGFSDLRVKTSSEPLYDSGNEGAFRITCAVSHMNNDDPMVFPGIQNATHHHTYYGHTNVKFDTNLMTLANNGNSTCAGGIMNRSAYWHTSIIDTKTNAAIVPDGGAIFYYKTGYGGVPITQITAPPTGLRILAGNPKATSASQKRSTFYQCMSNGRRVESIPNCGVGDTMQMEVEFPQCWNGKDLDSPDHISHMAEANGGCPASHPVAIPRITLNLRFKINTPNEALNWRLSSDNYAFNGSNAGYSGHADWVNGWDETFMKGIVRNCLNAGRDGRAHLLCDGRQFYVD